MAQSVIFISLLLAFLVLIYISSLSAKKSKNETTSIINKIFNITTPSTIESATLNDDLNSFFNLTQLDDAQIANQTNLYNITTYDNNNITTKEIIEVTTLTPTNLNATLENSKLNINSTEIPKTENSISQTTTLPSTIQTTESFNSTIVSNSILDDSNDTVTKTKLNYDSVTINPLTNILTNHYDIEDNRNRVTTKLPISSLIATLNETDLTTPLFETTTTVGVSDSTKALSSTTLNKDLKKLSIITTATINYNDSLTTNTTVVFPRPVIKSSNKTKARHSTLLVNDQYVTITPPSPLGLQTKSLIQASSTTLSSEIWPLSDLDKSFEENDSDHQELLILAIEQSNDTISTSVPNQTLNLNISVEKVFDSVSSNKTFDNVKTNTTELMSTLPPSTNSTVSSASKPLLKTTQYAKPLPQSEKPNVDAQLKTNNQSQVLSNASVAENDFPHSLELSNTNSHE